MMQGNVSISSRNRPAAIRSAMLGQVAGHELRGARGDGGTQDHGMPRLKDPQEVVERRADVAHVDLDVRERGRSQRDHDLRRLCCVGDTIRQRQPPALDHPLEQILSAGLGERHAPLANGAKPGGVVVDPDHPQSPVGERKGQRQPDSAEADDRYLSDALSGGHASPEVSGAS